MTCLNATPGRAVSNVGMKPRPTVDPRPPAPKDSIPDAGKVIQVLAWLMVGGVGVGLVFAVQATGLARFFGAAGVVAAVAGAASACGALVGFVFGIPRSLQGAGTAAAAPGSEPAVGQAGAPSTAPAGSGHDAHYGANTSLEQISDWLTKILVGVGLTQLTQLPGALESYATYIGGALPGMTGSAVFVGALTLHFTVCGFLAGYLWTRLKLGEALSKADVLTRAEFEREKKSNEVALQLVEQQLHRGMPPPDPGALSAAIAGADDLYRAHIYELARRERKDAENRKDPARIARTVPIFKALIARNPDRFHQNYGQLGYALLTCDPPDYDGCEANLTRAIELRGDWSKFGYPLYELTRAISRILRARGTDGRPARIDSAQQAPILADLAALTHVRWTEMDEDQQALVRDWAAANGVTAQIDAQTQGEMLRSAAKSPSKPSGPE